MGLSFVPFSQAHMHLFEAQPMQVREQEVLRSAPDALDELAKGHAFTAMVDGEVIGCGGIIEWWPDRCSVWAIVGKDAGPHMRGITRMVRAVLDRYPSRRIEATVREDFAQGKRWIRLLGFGCDGFLPAYSPLGEDVIMYSRIRDDRP
jgi:hypothetical protein